MQTQTKVKTDAKTNQNDLHRNANNRHKRTQTIDTNEIQTIDTNANTDNGQWTTALYLWHQWLVGRPTIYKQP